MSNKRRESVVGSYPSWIHPDRIPQIALLTTTLIDLGNALQLKNTDYWSSWSVSPQVRIPSLELYHCNTSSLIQPETEFAPDLARKLRPFQQLLVVQALRPDRLQSAIQSLACNILGLKTVEPEPVNLKRLFESETSPSEPILIITSPGADPSQV